MMNKLFKNKIVNNQTLGMLGIFILGLFLGIWIIHENQERCFDKYNFVNHHVACTHDPVISKVGYAKTQKELENYITKEISKGTVRDVAVYFRDLENGPVWGINETADFAPASLLKLPLVLVYFRLAEIQPKLFEQKLIFTGPTSELEPVFVTGPKLTIGQEYEIRDLLKRTLEYSDNDSYFLLVKHLVDTGRDELIADTFLELGIIAPQSMFDEVVSVRRYGAIFRGLYNSSFISSELSELALSWLSQSKFKQGIPGKLPSEIVVAHKFGERFAPDGSKQLHDCGIIYYPENPYLLCVMTRGDDWDGMLGAISTISEEVYKEVESRKVRKINK